MGGSRFREEKQEFGFGCNSKVPFGSQGERLRSRLNVTLEFKGGSKLQMWTWESSS